MEYPVRVTLDMHALGYTDEQIADWANDDSALDEGTILDCEPGMTHVLTWLFETEEIYQRAHRHFNEYDEVRESHLTDIRHKMILLMMIEMENSQKPFPEFTINEKGETVWTPEPESDND